jgi:hypothetical protein
MNIKNISENVLKNIFNHFNKKCKQKTNNNEIRQYLFLLNYIKNCIDEIINNYNNINNIDNDIYIINKIINIYFESYNEVVILFENYKQDKIILDSILASMTLKLFKNIKKSCIYHCCKSKLIDFNLIEDYEKCKNKKSRINSKITTGETAYPIDERPRADKDVASVHYQQQQIQKNNLPAIWLLNKNNNIYILDGFHRISACFIEKKYIIKAYIINIPIKKV